MKTFVEWLDEACAADPDNLLAPPLNGNKGIDFLCAYLLGEDYYVVDPCNNEQGNTVIVYDILRKYSRRFRKELKKYRKEHYR
jgi:hypothetical protein